MAILKFRLPPWFVAPTLVLLVAAPVWVTWRRGLPGLSNLVRNLVPVAVVVLCLILVEMRSSVTPCVGSWGSTTRRFLVFALTVGIDIYLLLGLVVA
jgi:hypothetical protein